MEPGKIDVNITFDENNQIRVLSSEKYRETENLKSECIDFLKSKYFVGPNFLICGFNLNRNHVFQRDGYHTDWCPWAASTKNRRRQTEGHRRQEQDRGWGRQPKKERARTENINQWEENDARETDIPTRISLQGRGWAEVDNRKIEQ